MIYKRFNVTVKFCAGGRKLVCECKSQSGIFRWKLQRVSIRESWHTFHERGVLNFNKWQPQRSDGARGRRGEPVEPRSQDVISRCKARSWIPHNRDGWNARKDAAASSSPTENRARNAFACRTRPCRRTYCYSKVVYRDSRKMHYINWYANIGDRQGREGKSKNPDKAGRSVPHQMHAIEFRDGIFFFYLTLSKHVTLESFGTVGSCRCIDAWIVNAPCSVHRKAFRAEREKKQCICMYVYVCERADG